MSGDDFYWIWLNRDDDSFREWPALLRRLASSFLPEPQTLELTGRRDVTITGWLDERLVAAFDRQTETVGLTGTGIQAAFGLTPSRTSMTLFFRRGPEPAEVRSLFVDLCETMHPDYGRVTLKNKGQELYDRVYAASYRTFYASGLYWLNYFSGEELRRQGGEALAANPHATATKTGDGLLLEVGGADDVLTPEGERRLIAATKAMPPVAAGDGEAEALPDTSDQDGDGPEPAPLTTIEGVRGFHDPSDGSFWVSRHVDPPRALDAKTVRRIQNLPGKGHPPISQVNLLFSTEEAARLNEAALRAVGARAWFVSPEDGQPRRV